MTTLFNPALIAAVLAGAFSLGLAAVGCLIVYLVQRELFSGVEDARARRVAESLFVAIVPLLIVFAIIMLFRMIDLWP